MLPLIPALILLIIQSATGYDRYAPNLGMPSSLPSHEGIRSRAGFASTQIREIASRQALAKLIAATGDKDLSAAFYAMFAPQAELGTQVDIDSEQKSEPAQSVHPVPHSRLASGFQSSSRSRDGPVGA